MSHEAFLVSRIACHRRRNQGSTRQRLFNILCRFLLVHPNAHDVLWATACAGRPASDGNTAGQYDRIVSRPERAHSASGGLR